MTGTEMKYTLIINGPDGPDGPNGTVRGGYSYIALSDEIYPNY